MLLIIAICDECGHKWLVSAVPGRCAKCRARKWNGANSTKTADEPATLGPSHWINVKPAAPIDPELDERIDSVQPVAELADGEPYRRSESVLAEKLKAALTDGKPAKSPYCRHGLAYHPGCNA